MPEKTNGEIPSTGNPRVDAALAQIWGKYKELDEAVLVLVHLENRHSQHVADHEQWLTSHQAAIARHEQWLAEVDDKLNALIDREMRREGGPEAR